jgi:L-iditol 2-dehydrogenase
MTPGIRLSRAGVLEHVDVLVPEPGEGEVLIRVMSVGLCGSDAHWYMEGEIGDATLGAGLILGHELCGVIESGPRSGERVAVDPAIPCWVCDMCVTGRSNLCTNLRFAGHGETDGGLRGHLVWPERCLVAVPDGVSDEEGALLEPLGVALHAMRLPGLRPGASVVVVGSGPIGLLLVAALRERGVEKIVVTDPLTHRLQAATTMGATGVLTATEDKDEMDLLLAAVEGGADVVFETAGTDSGVTSAVMAARPGGGVVLIGIPAGDRTSVVASVARRKELTLSWCRRMLPEDLRRAAELAAGPLAGLGRIVSHRYPMAAAAEAFQVLVDRSGLKVMVAP